MTDARKMPLSAAERKSETQDDFSDRIERWRWNDPPPDGLVMDEAGNVVAIEQREGDDDDEGAEDFDTRNAEFQRLAGVRPW
jgi:hypothetical protein